jgi:hypothetical protein
VWVSRARNEQLLASYAPIRGADGQVIGGLAIGTSLNDERLTNASDRTSGRILIAAHADDNQRWNFVRHEQGRQRVDRIAQTRRLQHHSRALASQIEPAAIPTPLLARKIVVATSG